MKSIVLWVGMAGLLLAGGANAQSGAELAKSKNCVMSRSAMTKSLRAVTV